MKLPLVDDKRERRLPKGLIESIGVGGKRKCNKQKSIMGIMTEQYNKRNMTDIPVMISLHNISGILTYE
ncbi:MAG: hypothetical protein JXB48_12670 [Candidatus Latescibacteria bacterium]|nr:hypothetical protein [Candidatus Latescibacterota bacterium]